MKTILLASLLAATVPGVTTAAVVGVENITGSEDDFVLVTSTGEILVSGFYALYTFGQEGASSPPASAGSLRDYGTVGLLDQREITSGNTFGGIFSAQFDFDNIEDADLFFVAGNGIDVSSSTELVMFDISGLAALSGNDTPTPQSLGNYFLAQPDALIGSIGIVKTFDPSGANITATEFILAPIPEPSAAGLTALTLAASVFARRRRCRV